MLRRAALRSAAAAVLNTPAAEQVDAVVIGAGVVGLAVARELAMCGREVLVLEQHSGFGQETSSRNSEVIHGGMYYPTGSLKAQMCVAGNRWLYEYCEEHNVPHKKLTKLIVAANDNQLDKLQSIQKQSVDNHCETLQWMEADEVRSIEPEVRCRAALLSPASGVVDSHSLMLALLGDAEKHGAMVAYNSRITGGRKLSSGAKKSASNVELTVKSKGDSAPPSGDDESDDVLRLHCRTVVNCAGLHANRIAESIEGVRRESVPSLYYVKGNYYTISGRVPFSRLVYPLPVDGGLGVHITLDLGGQARFGPDTEPVDSINYDLDETRAERFYQEIRSYWPDLPDGSLHADYSGIRPKLARSGFSDFLVQDDSKHGVPGLINLLGIESPGLTSAPILAQNVAQRV